jgi:hypothetical protein
MWPLDYVLCCRRVTEDDDRYELTWKFKLWNEHFITCTLFCSWKIPSKNVEHIRGHTMYVSTTWPYKFGDILDEMKKARCSDCTNTIHVNVYIEDYQ